MYEDQINRALGIFEHKNNVREHYYCVKEIFSMYKTSEQLEQLKNNHIFAIGEKNEQIADLLENLQEDTSFTSEEITAFHANWRRLNDLERPPQRSSGVYMMISMALIMIGFIFKCFVRSA